MATPYRPADSNDVNIPGLEEIGLRNVAKVLADTCRGLENGEFNGVVQAVSATMPSAHPVPLISTVFLVSGSSMRIGTR
jgi:hypothetical protein